MTIHSIVENQQILTSREDNYTAIMLNCFRYHACVFNRRF